MNEHPVAEAIDVDRAPAGDGAGGPAAVPATTAPDGTTDTEQARDATIAAPISPQIPDEAGPEELPPDFWEREVSFEDLPAVHDDGGETAAGERRAQAPSPPEQRGEPAHLASRSEPAADDAADGGGEDTFATLRQLFPGRILSIEPTETADDAPTDGDDGGRDPDGLDGRSRQSPDDAEVAVAKVD